ncbi:MAG TPA: hypothetical protein VEY07_06960 [Thermoplasmata archaeon]|nr:hypothetical protein [Thermoplasmata archaeon]
MVDLQETPAVPPFDPQGDVRAGWAIGGIVLLLLGWGLAVVVNVLLHLEAPASGTMIGPYRVFHDLGAFAWLSVGIGLFTGAIGAGLLWLSREAPRGPIVLPGPSYSDDPVG